MIKELIFKLKVKRLKEINIRQHLERQGFEIVGINSEEGKNLIQTLEIENYDKDGFTYQCGKFKYVFIGEYDNEDDRLMVLLHECGHIELNHQITSKRNEAQAWSFAYTVTELTSKIVKRLVTMLLPATLTFAIMQAHMTTNVQTSVPEVSQFGLVSNYDTSTLASTSDIHLSEENTTSDTVYVTRAGKKFHLADCYTIEGKKLIEYCRSEAEQHYLPCKVCRP